VYKYVKKETAFCYRYILFFSFCCLLGIVIGKYSLYLNRTEIGLRMLKCMGITFEETEEEFLWLWNSPETENQLAELLTIPKKNRETSYTLTSGRLDQPEYFFYTSSSEDNVHFQVNNGIMFGTDEKALILAWLVQNGIQCKERKFKLPSLDSGMETYHDINGDGMCDWRSISKKGDIYKELLLDYKWLPVDESYKDVGKEACVIMNGKSIDVIFQNGKWVIDDKLRNNVDDIEK